ncbi:ankyrin repeat-containing domain protein [Lentinula aff. detonsa]|nr:ankyrin repeat-containing domain protein [Lentinula aff. detonsa]
MSNYTLSASIVQDLKEYYEDFKVAAICVFCDFAFAHTQTVNALIASMLRQLVQTHPVVHSAVSSILDEIISSFTMSAEQFDRVFVIVDAVDECLDGQTRYHFLNTLNSLPINLLFTSRPHPLIEQMFEGCIRQDILADQHDLRIYSEERFALSRVDHQCSPESRQQILNQVVQKAGGMFVIARLLMDALMEAPNVKEALNIVRTMPTGVHGTYSRALQHIREGSDSTMKDLALYSLFLATFSRRILVFSEFEEAIATMFRLEDPCRCVASGTLAKESLVAACAGLITVEDKTDKVRLIHYTAHEYLVKEQENIWNNVQHKMAAVYEELRNAVVQHPFFDYALREWGYHVHDSGELKLVNEVLELLESDTHCTLGRLLTYDAMSSPKCTPWSALHFCAHFNLASTCLEIIDQNERHNYKKFSRSLISFFQRRRRQSGPKTHFSIDIRDDYEKTPLMVAASQGNVDMMRMLLGRKIDVDSKDFHARTALSYVMRSGSKEAVQLLLKQDIQSVNSKDIFGRTVLFDAVDSGSADIISLLLHYHDSDVEFNATDNSGRSALSHTVQCGYSDVVKILLQREGINVNQGDQNGMVPLLYASTEGHTLVTKLLCERKEILINALNENGRSSLSLAAQRGHEGVVNALLSSPEIDINLADLDLRTPLSFGAQYGRTVIVRALLSQKVAIDQKDNLGRTPLSYAAGERMKGEEIARDLLSAGADHNSVDDSGLTPLKYALKCSNRGVVDVLLSCPTISLKSNAGERSILSYAAQYGWTDIVASTMEHPDIDVNEKDDQEMHALAYAAKECHEQIICLLLAWEDIDISSSDLHGQTVLHHAASSGSEATVEQLISKLNSADINQLDDLGRSPLSLASLNGHIEVVKTLLSLEDLDVNSTDKAGLSPLTHAASSGHLKIVRLLLEQPDIQVWSVDYQGQNILTRVAKEGHARVLDLLLSHSGASEMVDSKDVTQLNMEERM